MIVKDETNSYVGIKCDTCPTMAPPAADILAGHGLNNMGWDCSGGSHLCPLHAPAVSRMARAIAEPIRRTRAAP